MARIVTLKNRHGVVQNEIEVEPLDHDLFLEFGKRVGETYEYVSLMRGNPKYRSLKGAKQLYFTHRIKDKWWVYDDTCLKLVEQYPAKDEAVQRLRQIAKEIIEQRR